MGCEIRLFAPRPPKCKVASFLVNYALKWPAGVLRAFLIDVGALLPLAECRVALFYRRVKTQKSFWRPMNRTVRLHLKNLCPADVDPDSPVFHGGGTRPNSRFRELCKLAGVSAKRDIESGEEQEWVLKDLRKTCATYYDEHMPESSIEILGHSAGGITYRHYALRAPLAFRAILSLPQPSAFKSLAQGFEGQCPCCRRRF